MVDNRVARQIVASVIDDVRLLEEHHKALELEREKMRSCLRDWLTATKQLKPDVSELVKKTEAILR